ncbi:MAG TPA: phosphoribosyltransferase family protein [Terriglobia bacterium]|nr:phosphoribosyltransferase family protein [Terriglobia bacterium]
MPKPLKSTGARRPRTSSKVSSELDAGLRVVYTPSQIRQRVNRLARQMNRDYKGKTLHVVGILETCFMFMADLVRALRVPVVCHFVRADMADTTVEGVPVREIRYTPAVDATGKDVLLVNGVLYSGVTLDYLYRYILGQGPGSVRTATLIERPQEKKVDVATDYLGFRTAASGYLVGYGLAYQGRHQNLPCIALVARA